MNLQGLFQQVVTGTSSVVQKGNSSGMLGGAAAGGIAALLLSSKKARKFAGSAAKVGGVALLGGLAYKAMSNWKQTQQSSPSSPMTDGMNNLGLKSFGQLNQMTSQRSTAVNQRVGESQKAQPLQLSLVKVMISAAHADGHIDQNEEAKILDGIQSMNYSEEVRSLLQDLVKYPESPEQLARGDRPLEERTEMYLVACFAIQIDTPEERTFLNRLANALQIPADLQAELEAQAGEVSSQAA